MSRLSLATLHDQMVVRDWQVLADIAKYRLLTSRQVQRLHFDPVHPGPVAAARACNRTLTRLRATGALRPLERRIGGVRAGSASYIWFLGPAGERLLQSLPDTAVGESESGRKAGRRGNYREPTRHFVDHTLAVAEVAVRTVEAARDDRFEVLRLETEPANWQVMLTPHGVATFLKPDLLLVTATRTVDGEFEDHRFVEVDLATESTTVIARQCAAYQAFRATGRYQAQHGLFPAVWWLTPTPRRAQILRAAVTRANDPVGDVGASTGVGSDGGGGLFRFCAAEDFPSVLMRPY